MNQNSFQLPDVDFAAPKPNTNTILSELPDFSTEGADSRAPHSSRRDLLEQSKLSRLPQRKPFAFDNAPSSKPVIVAVCVGCGGRLDGDDNFQQSVKVCRECLAHYAKIDSAIDEASRRKRRELLERFVGSAT